MPITAAPELTAPIIGSLSHLPTFDARTFADLVTIPSAAQSQIGGEWRARARVHLDSLGILFGRAARSLHKDAYAAQALLEEAQIRVAAAALCVRASALYEADYQEAQRALARPKRFLARRR